MATQQSKAGWQLLICGRFLESTKACARYPVVVHNRRRRCLLLASVVAREVCFHDSKQATARKSRKTAGLSAVLGILASLTFLTAVEASEIICIRDATEAIRLVAQQNDREYRFTSSRSLLLTWPFRHHLAPRTR